MVLKGKVDTWFRIFVVIANLVVIAAAVLLAMAMTGTSRTTGILSILVVLVCINVFFIPIIIQNYVELGPTSMLVVFGFMRTEIAYSGISRVIDTRSFAGSWAASVDRVRICGRATDIMIAVQDKQTFFAELKRKNPNILFESDR